MDHLHGYNAYIIPHSSPAAAAAESSSDGECEFIPFTFNHGTLSLYMSDLDSLPEVEAKKVTKIEINYCNKLTSIDLTKFRNLNTLEIITAGNLNNVDISNLLKLRTITIHNCHSLTMIDARTNTGLEENTSSNDFGKATKILTDLFPPVS